MDNNYANMMNAVSWSLWNIYIDGSSGNPTQIQLEGNAYSVKRCYVGNDRQNIVLYVGSASKIQKIDSCNANDFSPACIVSKFLHTMTKVRKKAK